MIKPNLDSNGRKLRLAFAILTLLYAIFAQSWIALLIACFIFAEVYFSWCLFFQLIGRNDCPVDFNKKNKS